MPPKKQITVFQASINLSHCLHMLMNSSSQRPNAVSTSSLGHIWHQSKQILYKVKILTAKHNLAPRVIIFSECAKQAITNGEMVGALEYNSADSRVECDNGYVGDAAITCTTSATWQLPLPECTPQGKHICPLITVTTLA